MSELPSSETPPAAQQIVRVRQLALFPPARPLVERFGADFFRALPKQPGVYFMCGAQAGVLYLGKARNLRRRLGNYRSAAWERLSPKMRRLLVSLERIYWDECPDENGAIERERRLLLALKPRFNTVGTYPAPKHHLGWLRDSGGFTIGFGDATAGWANRFGEFTRVKSVWAALLRLIWWALNPGASWRTMPLPLTSDRLPAAWRFATISVLLDELERRLADFLQGRDPALADWLLENISPGSRFEQEWRGQDGEHLREFYERIRVSNAPVRSREQP